MDKSRRLEIHNKCLTVRQDSGRLFVKAPARVGYEHILCVEGDKRVLADAFEEYVACDVFEHYVLCRDINYLTNQTVGPFTRDDILNKEMQFVYQNVDDSATLQIQSGDELATITTQVNQTATGGKEFVFGDDQNTISFTEHGTKTVVVANRTIQVTFISFDTAVYTIDRIVTLGFPENAIAGMDDLSGELVLQDNIPGSDMSAVVEELTGEVMLQDKLISTQFSAMIDEMTAEIVVEDIYYQLAQPTDLTVCPVFVVPPAPIPTLVWNDSTYWNDSETWNDA